MTTKDNSAVQPTDATSVALVKRIAGHLSCAAALLAQLQTLPPASRLAAAADDEGGVPPPRAPLALAFRTKNAAVKKRDRAASRPCSCRKYRGENFVARTSGRGGGKKRGGLSGVGIGLRASGAAREQKPGEGLRITSTGKRGAR